MNSREQEVECPKCGHRFIIYITRHGPIGSGAHYASQITRPNEMHELVLRTLEDLGAVSFETGITLSSLWLKVRQICLQTGRPVPTKQGLSGRLSELQGMRKTKCERNVVDLQDKESMQFRFKREQRWFLAARPQRQEEEQQHKQEEALTLDKMFF